MEETRPPPLQLTVVKPSLLLRQECNLLFLQSVDVSLSQEDVTGHPFPLFLSIVTRLLSLWREALSSSHGLVFFY